MSGAAQPLRVDCPRLVKLRTPGQAWRKPDEADLHPQGRSPDRGTRTGQAAAAGPASGAMKPRSTPDSAHEAGFSTCGTGAWRSDRVASKTRRGNLLYALFSGLKDTLRSSVVTWVRGVRRHDRRQLRRCVRRLTIQAACNSVVLQSFHQWQPFDWGAAPGVALC